MERVERICILDATDRDALKQSGVQEAKAVVVALPEEYFDRTLIVAFHLLELNVKRILVKIANDDHAKLLTKLGIEEIVFPEKDSAVRLARTLPADNLHDYWKLEGGFVMEEIYPPKEWQSKPLKDLGLRTVGISIVLLKRRKPDSSYEALLPSAGDKLQTDDKLIIIGHERDIKNVLRDH